MSFMAMVTLLFSFIIILPMTQFKLTSAMAIHDPAIPNCLTKCGDVDISLPFGIGRGCFFQGFEVICNQNIPYLSSSNLQLLEILPHEVRVSSKNFIAESCFSEEKRMGQAVIQLPEESPYTISITKNMFVIIGCYAGGEVFSNGTDTSGCCPSCRGNESMVNSSRSGIGCCQVPLPLVSKNLYIEVYQLAPSITNCTYGFVVENSFTESDLYGFNMNAEISTRLGWSVEIRDWNCSAARSSLCGANTQCKDLEDEHICTCLQGYEGNPYLYGSMGCRDIDECKTSPCVLEAKCRNEVPGFRCECPIGSSGDGRKDGNGCYKKVSYIKAALGHYSTLSRSSSNKLKFNRPKLPVVHGKHSAPGLTLHSPTVLDDVMNTDLQRFEATVHRLIEHADAFVVIDAT
ncbi:hypothetical protein MRB53_009157 [Persea americana]|uniref:Uncharacterized protein n=1 Tax=Persea americana TaxID=3435 RepID=A0ACC2LN60_PERAE|nr:hypothetical protein MRB53_009157 [Persea americana]